MTPALRCSVGHHAYTCVARSFGHVVHQLQADFKMCFRSHHPEPCTPCQLPWELQVGRQHRTSFCSNTWGLGTTISNANARECQLIYLMEPLAWSSCPTQFISHPLVNPASWAHGLHVLTQLNYHCLRVLDLQRLILNIWTPVITVMRSCE